MPLNKSGRRLGVGSLRCSPECGRPRPQEFPLRDSLSQILANFTCERRCARGRAHSGQKERGGFHRLV